MSKSKCTKHLSVGPLLEVDISKKMHAVVARSTFSSQNGEHPSVGPLLEVEMSKKCTPGCGAKHISKSKMYKNTSVLGRFWKLTCRKSARRCGAKRVSKSKCTKTTSVSGRFLEVDVSKKCTPLWREAHFKVRHHMFGPSKLFRGHAQGIVHLVKSEQNVRVLWHFQ